MNSLRTLASATLLAGALGLVSGTWGDTVAGALGATNCLAGHLSVKIGTPQGTAGTIYYPIVITNAGPACALWGVPRIQPVVGNAMHRRVAVGPAARNVSIGEMPTRHTLAPNHAVSDAFGVTESGNYTPSSCHARNAGGVVVSLGGFIKPTFLALRISVCTKIASTSTRLITPGTTGA